MKTWILPIALLGAVAVSGCERTVVTPPNATVVTPSPAVVAVPGPSGPAGPQGAPGKTSTDTVVVVPPASSSEPTKTN